MTIYLYLKTHKVTGLKYLGKTTQDPYSYKGSGIYWLKHLKKHGCDVITEVLFQCQDAIEFSIVAKSYSKSLNILESPEFANLCPEEGQGGYTAYTAERNEKISKALKGRHAHWISKGMNKDKVLAIDTATNETVSITTDQFNSDERYVGIGTRNLGKKYAKRKSYKRVNQIIACPHCGKAGAKNTMTRYHFDNCKTM
jgi:hypothetical protein